MRSTVPGRSALTVTPWTAATVPIAVSVAGHSSSAAAIVVTASGGGWKAAAWPIAVCTCLNFTNPSAATIITVATIVTAMRFAMNVFSSCGTHCRSPAGVRTIRQIGHGEVVPVADEVEGPCTEADLRPLDDARGRELLDNECVNQEAAACTEKGGPAELTSADPEVLRAALAREYDERVRAECLATMQAEVVQLALALLVREPDLEGFFGGLTKAMVEDTESHLCAVWLLNDDRTRCDLWMAFVGDRLYTRQQGNLDESAYPHDSFKQHLMTHVPGWSQTIEYGEHHEPLPPH